MDIMVRLYRLIVMGCFSLSFCTSVWAFQDQTITFSVTMKGLGVPSTQSCPVPNPEATLTIDGNSVTCQPSANGSECTIPNLSVSREIFSTGQLSLALNVSQDAAGTVAYRPCTLIPTIQSNGGVSPSSLGWSAAAVLGGSASSSIVADFCKAHWGCSERMGGFYACNNRTPLSNTSHPAAYDAKFLSYAKDNSCSLNTFTVDCGSPSFPWKRVVTYPPTYCVFDSPISASKTYYFRLFNDYTTAYSGMTEQNLHMDDNYVCKHLIVSGGSNAGVLQQAVSSALLNDGCRSMDFHNLSVGGNEALFARHVQLQGVTIPLTCQLQGGSITCTSSD